jgi:hypothetical protein
VRGAEDVAIESAHGVDVPDAQDDVVDALDGQHGNPRTRLGLTPKLVAFAESEPKGTKVLIAEI